MKKLVLTLAVALAFGAAAALCPQHERGCCQAQRCTAPTPCATQCKTEPCAKQNCKDCPTHKSDSCCRAAKEVPAKK